METTYRVMLAMMLKKDILVKARSRDEVIRVIQELERKVFHLLWLLSN